MGLARCTYCHMPVMNSLGHGPLTGHSHAFSIARPEYTIMYPDQGGEPNSCAMSCHDWRVDVFGIGFNPTTDNTVWNSLFQLDLAQRLDDYADQWWGEDKADLLPAH